MNRQNNETDNHISEHDSDTLVASSGDTKREKTSHHHHHHHSHHRSSSGHSTYGRLHRKHSDSSEKSSSGHSHSHHHHHHHHHSSSHKKDSHEYEVHYGKYNFSVNPEEENIPVAKYRRVSQRQKKREIQQKENPKKKRSKAFIIFRRIGITLAVLLVGIAITLAVLVIMGRNNLLQADNIKLPVGIETDGDYIIYKGHKYKFNDRVFTMLFAGVDRKTEEHNENIFGTAGQADAIFLLAVDTQNAKYKLMALSRDSMVDVNVCDMAGNFKGVEKMQICLSHAYGDGAETSNENLKRSISRLFYGITVDAYFTVDLDVIPILNDDVGGVTVNVIEDLTNWNPIFKKGETITLKGNQAETYIRARDVMGDENQNNLRMERQKGYIDGFVNNTLSMTRRNITTPVRLYNDVTEYSRTDITVPIISYLATLLVGQSFEADEDMVKIPGKTVMGEKYAEFYVDEAGLFDIIIQAYYIRID